MNFRKNEKIMLVLKNSAAYFNYNNHYPVNRLFPDYLGRGVLPPGFDEVQDAALTNGMEVLVMTRNQAILAELLKYLDEIRVTICLKNIRIYEHELNQLKNIIERSLKVTHRSSFFEKNDVVKSIMRIIQSVNKDIESLELEMQGVANYSCYECQRLNDILFKQAIKDNLNIMLHLIVQARPEIRDAKLSGIAKMLA